MKKNIIVFYCFLSFYIFSFNNELTKELLTSSKWVGDLSSFKFSNNNSVIIEDLYDDANFYYTGTYSINDNKLIVEYSIVKEKSKSLHTELLNEKYKIEYTLNDLGNSSKIELRDVLKLIKFEIKFEIKDKLVDKHKKKISLLKIEKIYSKNNIITSNDNNNFVLLKNEEAFTNENLKFREAPSLNAKSYILHILFNEYKYLPKGTEVILLARTENTYKVENWEDYWYYIDLKNLNPFERYIMLEGSNNTENIGFWIYGAFITKDEYLKNYNKAYDYSKKGDNDNALIYFLKAYEIDSTKKNVIKAVGICYYNKAIKLYNNKNYNDAKELFKKAIEYGIEVEKDIKEKLDL